MTKAQIAAILIFLKEAWHQIDSAKLAALAANNEELADQIGVLRRQLRYEIIQLEVLHQNAKR